MPGNMAVHRFISVSMIPLLVLCFLASTTGWLPAAGMLEIAELLSHPEQYDRQMVTVVGRVTNFQIATTRQGQLAYGFLLRDESGTVKVVGLGKLDVREGDQVIVEGVFSRLRQTGRAVVYNEIKAAMVRPLDRLNPDLVG